MGEFGSGGWNATGRPTTAECFWLNVNVLNRTGALTSGLSSTCQWSRDGENAGEVGIYAGPNNITLTYNSRVGGGDWNSHRQRIAISWEPCRLGGERPYFHCPSCGRRVLQLYVRGQFFCRHCHGLSYPSQRERESDRAQRKANHIRKRLGGEPGWQNIPARPKGMHKRTYERLRDEIITLDAVTDDVAIRMLARLHRPLQIQAKGFWI
jgi:hypothetical protein